MPKLPSIKPRQLQRFFEQNGFVLDHTSGSHYIFYHPITHRRAVIPIHNRDLPKGTLLANLRQSGFSKADLDSWLKKR